MKTFKLLLITPYVKKYDGEVKNIICKNSEGEFSINVDYQHFLSTTVSTELIITDDKDNKISYFVSGGMIEVSNNVVTLCVDSAETREEIDIKRAELAKERAENRLTKSNENDDVIEELRINLALQRAIARIDFYNNKNL